MTRRPTKLLLTADAVGGVWQYTLDLARGLGERGVGAVLAVLGPGPSPRRRAAAEAAGLQVVETGLPLDWTARDAASIGAAQPTLEALATELHCDGAHLHTPALAASGPWRIPCVAVSHSCVATWWGTVRGGALPPDFRWRTELVAAGMGNADAVLAPSRAHADAVAAAYAMGPPLVVHNGQRTGPPATGPARPGQHGRGTHLLAVGRLWDEAKGLAELDALAGRLGIPVRAAGPLEGPHGVSVGFAAVQPLGVLDDQALAQEYASCGAFVSLARYEPFGLAVLEAASAGAPIILSDIPTFRELWDGAALFVAPGDERGLRAAVDAATGHPEWGTRARARALRYPLDAFVERTLAIHRQVATRVREPLPA